MTKSKVVFTVVCLLILVASILLIGRKQDSANIVIGKMEQSEFSAALDWGLCSYHLSRSEIVNMQYLHTAILAGNLQMDIDKITKYFAKINGQLIEFKNIDGKWIGGGYELVVNETSRWNINPDPESGAYEMSGNFVIKNIKTGKSIKQEYVGACAP
jgi:hypothetical protein